MLTVYFTPFIILAIGNIGSLTMLFTLYIIAGFGKAGIGMGIMHDAIHGSYSSSKTINKIMGYTMNLIGANANIWRIQHNVLHHTYTNVEHSDEDINAPFFLRFSPNAPLNKMHRFQHFYIWFFYGLSTLSWVTIKDYVRMYRFYKMGQIRKEDIGIQTLKITLWKLIYYSFTLIIPIIVLPFSVPSILLAFFFMHFITGFLISIVFQTAHIMPNVDFPEPDTAGNLEHNWYIHQLMTTSNFSPNNKIFSWLIGGLNYQVEHHLWPNISHIHYNKISQIVRDTTRQFNVPYHVKNSFSGALQDHAKMIKNLGRPAGKLIPAEA